MKKVTQLFLALAIAATANVSCSKPQPPVANSRINVVEVTVPPTPRDDGRVHKFPVEVERSIFVIMPFTPDRQRAGGTGFLVHTEKHGTLLITNRHVCEAMNEENVIYYAEQGAQLYVARRLHASDRTDLCAIVPPPELVADSMALELAKKDLVVGQHVNVFGHPYLNPLTYTHGMFLNITREPLRFRAGSFSPDAVFLMGRVNFMVHPGNSGSPLLDDNNQIVGVIFAMEGDNHHGLFIPLAEVQHFLETLE